MNRQLLLKSTFVFALLLAFTVSNAQIALWNYEPLQGSNSNPAANSGSAIATATSSIVPGAAQSPGTAQGIDSAGTGCGGSSGSVAGAWQFTNFDPGSATDSNGVQFNASTVGYTNIIFSWDQRFSNASPNTARLQYTTDGTTWINANMSVLPTTICATGSSIVNGCIQSSIGNDFRRTTVDFSSITAVNNNVNFGVRILASYDPNYGSSPGFGGFRQTNTPGSVAINAGTWRFDNVSITGSAVSGPNPVTMNGTISICPGTSTNINVTFTGGTAPFTLVYTDGSTPVTILNYTSGTPIAVTPGSTKTYTVTSLTDGNAQLGTGITGSAVITVYPAVPAISFAAGTSLFSFTNCVAAGTGFPLPGTSVPAGSYAANFPVAANSGGFTTTYRNAATDAVFTFPTYTGGSFNFYFRKTNNVTGCYINSPTYSFTRNTAPAITTQPATTAQSVCQGDAFSAISVAASGSATLLYQWYRNTSNSLSSGTPLIGASYAAEVANGSTTATFTPLSTYSPVFPAVLPLTYYYYVTVTNTCTGVKSTTPISFTITQPTVAGSVASAQTICAGNAPADLVLSGNTGLVVKWERANDIGFTTGVADIASTSTTLTGAAIGPLTQTTYFRAYVQNGSCSVKTTTPIQVLIKSTSWVALPGPPHWTAGAPDSSTTAIFTTNYSSSADVSACSVQITSGDVVFNTGHTLFVENTLDVSGGTLTFEDTASLLQGSAVTTNNNIGNIKYKRISKPMRKFDYTYWSSPVDSQTLTQSPTGLFVDGVGVPLPMQPDKYYWFDTATYLWANPLSSTMDTGLGYIIRAPLSNDPFTPSAVTATFTGKPNNGTYPVNIVKTGANDLNCIGNPYPSAISADLFVAQNAAAFTSAVSPFPVGTTFYFWTHNSPIDSSFQYVFSDYATYNFSGGTGTGNPSGGPINSSTPNGMIAAGQSFMVKGIVEGTSPAAFKNSMRQSGSNNFFFRMQQNPEKNRVWLELKNNQGAYKQILVGYIENATNGYDNGYDGEVLETGNPVRFYSILADKKLAIQGKALPFADQDKVALGFTTAEAANYEINLSDFDGLFVSQDVYIEDRLLDVIHNLKEGPYAFAADSGTFDTRFVLRFNAGALGTANPVFDTNAVIVYKNQSQLTINSGNTIMRSVKIFDISGRLLLERNHIDATEISFVSGFAHEVLMVQITSVNNETLTKKVIN